MSAVFSTDSLKSILVAFVKFCWLLNILKTGMCTSLSTGGCAPFFVSKDSSDNWIITNNIVSTLTIAPPHTHTLLLSGILHLVEYVLFNHLEDQAYASVTGIIHNYKCSHCVCLSESSSNQYLLTFPCWRDTCVALTRVFSFLKPVRWNTLPNKIRVLKNLLQFYRVCKWRCFPRTLVEA